MNEIKAEMEAECRAEMEAEYYAEMMTENDYYWRTAQNITGRQKCRIKIIESILIIT